MISPCIVDVKYVGFDSNILGEKTPFLFPLTIPIHSPPHLYISLSLSLYHSKTRNFFPEFAKKPFTLISVFPVG